MASLINVRLNRGDATPWGFRLQGGKDFGTPLLIQKVNGNSLAEKAGLQVGDAVIRVNGTEVFNLRHKDAQDIIVRGGNNIEVSVQRGGNATWKPSVTPVGSTPTPTSHLPSKPAPVTKTSLAAGRPQAPSTIGSAHNLAPRPYPNTQVNGEPVKSIVNKQYNTPVNIYSEETIAETLSAQAEVLAGGVLGVNFKKNEKGYDAEKSEVFKMVQEAEREPKSPEPVKASTAFYSSMSHATGGRAVSPRPITPIAQQMSSLPPQTTPYIPSSAAHQSSSLPPQTTPYMPQSAPSDTPKCTDCSKFIVGVFVRIKDKNLHVECFKCATCGSSLKNVGYYNINNKLYCDIHAKMVARQNPPTQNLDPITVSPGSRAPAGTISAALSSNAPSAGPQSPQPSTIAPVPFHQQSSPSVPATTAPKPFGSVSAPAPFTPPAAPPAPAAPFYTKQQPELPPSDKWPPKKDETQPVATATPLYIPPPAISETAVPVEKSVPELPSPQDPPCCIDIGKRMSICSEEVCELSEQKKAISKSDNLISLTEESSDRPESPVPFNKQDSVESTPKQELQSLDISLQNLNMDENKSENSVTQNFSAESLQVSAQQGSSSSQNVEVSEEGSVTHTRKTKVEESFSHNSASYSSVRSSNTISRCITPEICEIMEKPRGSPSLLPREMDRPATPQQVVVFPPEIPAFVPLPRSRTSTPQPHALQRILSEELGLKPQQPPVPVEELRSEKVESFKSSEGLYTKSQVDEIVQKELQKYKTQEVKFSETVKTEDSKSNVDFYKTDQKTADITSESFQQKEQQLNSQSATSITQRFETNKFEHSQTSYVENVNIETKPAVKSEKIETNNKTLNSLSDLNKIESQNISSFLKKEERPYSPVQAPRAVIRPKPQPVSLPPETKPYVPPPPPPEEEQSEKPKTITREEACQSPLVSALTVAPNRPYSPLPVPTFKPISLEDLPSPPEGGQPLSLLSALTIAPDTPYSPFPEPVNVSKQSPPKFTKEISSEPPKPVSLTKPLTSTISEPPSKPKVSFEPDKFVKKTKDDSAFKPVVQKPTLQTQPQPLPLPETVKLSQSTPSKTFPPVAAELKSVFASKSQATAQKLSTSSSQNISSSAPSLSESSSGIRKPDLLPYYQQNIGEIPLAHRPQSPVPHAIRAPTFKNATEPKRTVSDQIKSSANYSNDSSLKSSPAFSVFKSGAGSSSSAGFKSSTGFNSSSFKTSAGYSSSSGYVSSSVYGQTFTAAKEETQSYSSSSLSSSGGGGGSDNILPYYQQNIGEIPLAHRPKSPVPHAIKAPSTEPTKPIRPASTPIKPSPLAGKAPETLSKSKQVFKPETKYQNVFAAPPEPSKPLQKTLPHFSQPTTTTEKLSGGAPWFVKKLLTDQQSQDFTQQKIPDPIPQPKAPSKFQVPSTQPKAQSQVPDSIKQSNPPSKLPDFSSSTVSSQKSTPQTNHKLATGFTPPSQNKTLDPPTTSVPPAGAGGPGNKGATFAGSTAPRRGRGTLNPSVGPGARIPLCGSCNRQIRGPFITALGKIWCPEHFMCANAQCRRPLQDIGFVEENTGLYCEYCFEQYLAPNCNKCSSKIKGDCLNAIGKHFHPECFCCAYCGKLFGNSPFFLEDALPYCENDWNELFTTKCFTCGFPIEAGDRWVEALSNNYHSQCFNCTMCKKNLEGQSFFAKGGRPFCKNHAR